MLFSPRLLHLLPGENLLLLRHVIAVLHCIQGNAQDNQMNAFNLSVCIAPSMLWSQAPSTPEMEGEGAKKVTRGASTCINAHHMERHENYSHFMSCIFHPPSKKCLAILTVGQISVRFPSCAARKHLGERDNCTKQLQTSFLDGVDTSAVSVVSSHADRGAAEL